MSPGGGLQPPDGAQRAWPVPGGAGVVGREGSLRAQGRQHTPAGDTPSVPPRPGRARHHLPEPAPGESDGRQHVRPRRRAGEAAVRRPGQPAGGEHPARRSAGQAAGQGRQRGRRTCSPAA
ncbi:hypothetical protein GCM10018781_64330 [Kitasatospora indigofera]|uniref:Uncharacterized protein n=1 Tax=Kitasatospora indigofera TaxID=67307 RepID=A0A919L1L4_9ACTN|nr:hypothetical protein GCM10018781_64330 [Kitasatospora indigofera]